MQGFPVPRELFLLHIVPQMSLVDFIKLTITCKSLHELLQEQWPWCYFFHANDGNPHITKQQLWKVISSKYQYLIYHTTPSSMKHSQPEDFEFLLKKRLDEQRKLRQRFEYKASVKWDDVKGLQEAKDTLKEVLILPAKFPQLFVGRRRSPWQGILLYGPPGCGKTLLANALSSEFCGTFLRAQAYELVSKWSGEGEKIVRQLFTLARSMRPCVIFIDEIDVLCDSDGYARRVYTELLVNMQSVNNTDVFVIVATNSPWNLSSGVKRRLEKTIYVGMPDKEARSAIITKEVSHTAHTITKEQFNALGEASVGYSCSDICSFVRDACMEAVREIQKATHFRKVPVGETFEWRSCSSMDEGAVAMTWQDIPESEHSKLKVRELTVDDVLNSIRKSRPSVNDQDVARCIEAFS